MSRRDVVRVTRYLLESGRWSTEVGMVVDAAGVKLRACAAPDCRNPFAPRYRNAQFCSDRCGNRIKMRRLRAKLKEEQTA